MTYAITGASGHLAGLTAEHVLQRVDPSDVVLISRRPHELTRFGGVTTRAGDFTRPDTLRSAFDGVDTLLLVSTDVLAGRLEQQRAAITAAAEAGVERIVYTSVPNPVDTNPALAVPSHAGTEHALRDSGLRWTVLRNNLYAHMQLPVLQQAGATGQLVTNVADGRTAYVTREDCAAAAAAVLVGDGHDAAIYDITGPDAVGADDLAALASELANKPVTVAHVSDDDLTAGYIDAGLPPEVAQLLVSFGASTRLGYLDTVTTAVADLTGHQPTSLRDSIGL